MVYSLSTTSPFIKGLNTELNKLVDSSEYTSEELNCMIRANNTRSRRPGIDYEELYKFNNQYLPLEKKNLAFNCIEWTDINSPDEAQTYTGYPYIVCQVGGKIIFFRNQGQPYSKYQEEYVLDLQTYRLDSSSEAYMTERCKFTAAYGCIYITSKAIKPIYLRSAQPSNDPAAPTPTLPSCSVSCAFGNSKKGRIAGDGFATFFIDDIQVGKVTIKNIYGSTGNCESGPWLPCSTQLANYFNSITSATRSGIIATPKYDDGIVNRWGINSVHSGNNTGGNGYIPDDYITFTAPVGSGTTLRGTKVTIHLEGMGQWRSSSEWLKKDYEATMAGGTNYVYKNNIVLSIRDTHVGANDFLAVDDNPVKMSYAHLYNLLNQGWTPALIAKYYHNQSPKVFPGNNLAQQFLKDSNTEAFKPQNAINMTFGNTPAARGHMVLEYFDQKRVTKSNLVNAFTQLVSALVAEGETVTFADIVDTSFALTDPTQSNLTDALSQVPNTKPRKNYVADICAYAGRIFYLSGDVLLYSQVIAEDISKSDTCYTEADPTGEKISDVVDTDGGMISLPEIGEGLKLVQVGESLVVFGTRGNMLISGTANNIFTATAYSAGEVGAVPTQSPDSFVTTEYGVFYWGVTGINVLAVTDQGLQVRDLSTDKILTFFGKISNDQHKACKGVYSSSKKKIYWFYPEDLTKPRSLNLCLVYDIQRDAFTPQKIVTDSLEEGVSFIAPEVVSGVQLKVPFKSVKEYPLYAELITTPESHTYSYTNLYNSYDTIEQSVKIPSSLTMRNNFEVTGNGSVTTRAGSQYYITNTQAFDICCKTVIDNISCIPASGYSEQICGTKASNGIISLTGRSSGAVISASMSPNTYYESPVTLTNGCALWVRLVWDTTKLRVYHYVDTTNTKKYTDLPALTSWTSVITNDDWTTCTIGAGAHAEMYDCVLSFTPGFTAGSIGKRWLDLSGLHVTGYFYEPPRYTPGIYGSQTFYGMWVYPHTTSYYYNTVTKGNNYYADTAMTMSLGTLDSLYSNAMTFNRIATYSETYPQSGTNGTVYAKKWVSVLGDKAYVYMSSSVQAQYPNNTRTSATDANLFYDVHMKQPVQEAGRISITNERLSEANVNEPLVKIITVTYLNEEFGNEEIVDDSGYKVLADDPLDTEEFTYESSILLCLDPYNCKVTFGDFRNNYMRDWAEGDYKGDGYVFDSYMVSHPMNAKDFLRNKTMPYLMSYFKRTETGKTTQGDYIYGSKCQGSVRWDWHTRGDNSKWDSPNELYRPNRKTLLSEGYVTSKTNIRGIGRAYQVKLQGVGDNNFVVEALGFNLQQDERI